MTLKAMPDSLQHNTAAPYSFLGRLNNDTSINADLRIEVDQAAFSLVTRNKKLLVIVKEFSDMQLLAKRANKMLFSHTNKLERFEAALHRMNLTVYVQTQFLPVLGPKANPLLKKILYWYISRQS